MRLQPVPLTILITYYRLLLPVLPVSDRFASKRSALVRKVIKLFASLTAFLQCFDGNLFRFCTRKRESRHKERDDQLFHKYKLAGGREEMFKRSSYPGDYATIFSFYKFFPIAVHHRFFSAMARPRNGLFVR